MTRAAGYVRVSTDEQNKHGWNIGKDRELIRKRAEDEGWHLMEPIFDDGGVQGDVLERPGLQGLLGAVESKAVDVVIMRNIDRLSRDRFIYALAARTFELAGVKMYEFERPQPVKFDQETDLRALFAQWEKQKISERVKLSMKSRTEVGLPTGGTPRYGFAWDVDTRKTKGAQALVQVPAQAKAVLRVFTDYASGLSQRVIQRTLNAEGVPAPGGGLWGQSAITRILSDPIYVGKLTARHGDSQEVVEGAHDPIVDDELWDRVQKMRGGSRKGGQHTYGQFRFVRGVLRCGCCNSAMIADRGRGRRDRYICRGRVEHGASFCSQGSVVRENIDDPFIAELLDNYVDLEAMRERIGQRASSVLEVAHEQLDQRQRDAAKAKATLERVRADYRSGDLDAATWNEERQELTDQFGAAQEAAQRAEDHVQRVEQAGVPDDAEQLLLDHLARLRKAVVGAPDLHALRNVIGDIFESVTLVRGDDPRWEQELRAGAGVKANTYWLVPKLRPGLIDWEAGGVKRAVLQTDATTKVTG